MGGATDAAHQLNREDMADKRAPGLYPCCILSKASQGHVIRTSGNCVNLKKK